MNEVWKDIEGYEELYEVSNHGRVRSKAKITTSNFNEKVVQRQWQPRFLKNKNPSGRDVRVALWKDKKPKDFLVHRLVAAAFIPRIEGKECVNHIDGNPKNNHISNLEWCDYGENNNHAFDNGLIGTARRIVLVNKATTEAKYFRSASKASQFLGQPDVFVSHLLERGISEYEGYEIYIKINQIPKNIKTK